MKRGTYMNNEERTISEVEHRMNGKNDHDKLIELGVMVKSVAEQIDEIKEKLPCANQDHKLNPVIRLAIVEDSIESTRKELKKHISGEDRRSAYIGAGTASGVGAILLAMYEVIKLILGIG